MGRTSSPHAEQENNNGKTPKIIEFTLGNNHSSAKSNRRNEYEDEVSDFSSDIYSSKQIK